jgi:hypothetical protein
MIHCRAQPPEFAGVGRQNAMGVARKGNEALPMELSNRLKEGCHMVPYPVPGVPF